MVLLVLNLHPVLLQELLVAIMIGIDCCRDYHPFTSLMDSLLSTYAAMSMPIVTASATSFSDGLALRSY